MPRRLLPLVAAALLLAVSAGCSDAASTAARVGDTRIDDGAFLDEVAEWVGNPQAIDPSTLDTTPGTYPLELVRQLLQQRIDFELNRQEFEAQGLELDDDMRTQALTALLGDPSQAELAFDAFSDDFAADFVDDLARQTGLQAELGADGYAEWRTEAYADADIDVNPRYGSWNADTGQITPPPGPVDPAASVPSGA